MKKLGIFIVNYNSPRLLVPQLEGLKRFCEDEFEVVVIDNSFDEQASEAVKYHSKGCRYVKTNATSRMGSQSHSFAANIGYGKFKDDYEYQLWIDHDLYPIRPFTVVETLGEKLMAGLGQERGEVTYFWPGLFFFNAKEIGGIDFSPSPGLDTGGGTHKLIDKYGKEKCLFLDEVYFENPYYKCDNPKYNYYTILGGTFMHFIGSSDWEGVDRNDERLGTLFNILQELTQ